MVTLYGRTATSTIRERGEAHEDFEFTLRELVHGRPGRAVELRQCELLRQRGFNVAPARSDGNHGLQQSLGSAALGEESECAFLQRAARVHEVVVRR